MASREEKDFQAGFNKVRHGIPDDHELAALSTRELRIFLASQTSGSAASRVVEAEISSREFKRRLLWGTATTVVAAVLTALALYVLGLRR
jgi:hypothetical protein